MDPVRPGWHADPRGGTYERWWDGSSWTTATRPLGSGVEPPGITSPLPSETAPWATPDSDAADTAYTPPAYYPSASAAPSAPTYPQVPPYPGAGPITGAPVYPGPGYAPQATYGQSGIVPGMQLPVGVWRSSVDDRPPVNGLGRAIAVCFQRYASFDGRAGQAEFWYFMLAMVIFSAVWWVLSLPLAVFGMFLAPLIGLAGLALILPSLAVTVRRLRDAGYPWGLIFLVFVPFGAIVLLVLCAQQSKYP